MTKFLSGIAIVAASTFSHAAGDTQPYMYTVTGACDVRGGLDGQTFLRQVFTANGAPWYKAIDSNKYMYWDPDCMGSGDGTPRWIIDEDMPNVTKMSDLDGDGFCEYIARINSEDAGHPPVQGTWTMQCAGTLQGQYLILLEGTTTSTTIRRVATTTKAGSGGVQTTTTTRTASPSSPGPFILEGSCPFKGFLNRAVFDEEGTTQDGRPYFKARNQEQYMYFDKHCDGNDQMGARWVLDASRPSTSVEQDLDQDGKCDYHARVDSAGQQPPTVANWRMYCGATAGGWVNVELILRKVTTTTTTTGKPMAVSAAGRASVSVALAALVAAVALAL